MKTLLSTIAITALVMTAVLPVSAQERRISPHETFSSRISGDRVTVTYGRPYTVKPGTTEARKIWGSLVPWGEPWRLGADEATLLITQKTLVFADKTIPPGAYTLYMVPKQDGASQLAFSTDLGGWGIPVDTDHDLTRVDLTKTDLHKPVEQFTMTVTRSSGGGLLKLSWENEEFSVPFTVQK